jgi:hypothetical protein
MRVVLTGLLVSTGLVAVTVGVGRYAADRWRHRKDAITGHRLAPGVALTAAGGGLVLSPDVLVLTDQLQVADPAAALALGVYNVLAMGGLGTVAAGMWLSSRRVTRQVRAGVDAVADGIPLVARRRAMRRGTPADFPREWASLIALDTELTQRLLRYERDLEAAVNFPVMSDHTDPLTRGAIDAMLRCRELRAATPPAGTRDVRDTDYARAVADFQVALEAAEANAERLVASTFTEDERRTLEEVTATLEFMRANSTTPGERAAAYDEVSARLTQVMQARGTSAGGAATGGVATGGVAIGSAETGGVATGGVAAEGATGGAAAGATAVAQGQGQAAVARPHPFLDVTDRARR